ncbi:MAG TPA: hypothetical protein PK307_09040 [Spirochaetota bacterium]|nr:hypothetical protein [Spirochaetota bacterium]HOD15899.1 hypothetical protein [Spirochaetota bacterium]HPG50670.1 hypothetical protein [Spirochaetota bacterium]HPN12101.1 hypothetical protein [Spirochaetota bacterium]HQL82332.1 hypothetical protein [Spirochaetota bacterium]
MKRALFSSFFIIIGLLIQVDEQAVFGGMTKKKGRTTALPLNYGGLIEDIEKLKMNKLKRLP